MIYSPGRRYLFIHQPKTGGTAMALALEARAMKDDIMLGDTPKARKRRSRVKDVESRGRLWKHSTLADLDGLVPRDALDDLFVFTLVRNPWDRLVSYYHWLKDQSFDHPAVGLSKELPFDAFLRHPMIAHSIRETPSRHYVTDANGKERCAAFIRLEHFEDDAAPLFDHLGFRFGLERVNSSHRNCAYDAYYDTELRDFVANICSEDIARFEYEYD